MHTWAVVASILDFSDTRLWPVAAESKVTVSHSTIEKQRRDRINSLIDEVRRLVQGESSCS